jgi:sporulation protein YlmC with PRC-barrel domain
MVSGKYFNKGVKALDSPHVGHVVRETNDRIVVFGEGDDRYDIPTSKIRFAAGNVLVDLPEPIDLATYEGKYPKSLFNKGVRTQDEEHVGHVMKETDDKVVVWGHYDRRFDAPKSKIVAVGRNVILGMNYPDVFKYKVERSARLPDGKPVDTLAE